MTYTLTEGRVRHVASAMAGPLQSWAQAVMFYLLIREVPKGG